jgi:hypothetical protein
MRKSFRPGMGILLAALGVLALSLGCVKRPGVLATESSPNPPPAKQSEAPAPSPVLRKKKPPPSFELGLPLQDDLESPDPERLKPINDYLYANDSVKAKKLTGVGKVLYDTWDAGKYAVAGAAFIGFLETQHKK